MSEHNFPPSELEAELTDDTNIPTDTQLVLTISSPSLSPSSSSFLSISSLDPTTDTDDPTLYILRAPDHPILHLTDAELDEFSLEELQAVLDEMHMHFPTLGRAPAMHSFPNGQGLTPAAVLAEFQRAGALYDFHNERPDDGLEEGGPVVPVYEAVAPGEEPPRYEEAVPPPGYETVVEEMDVEEPRETPRRGVLEELFFEFVFRCVQRRR